MKIFHHTDDDGYCSAAIVFRYLIKMYDIPTEEDFFPYSYGRNIELPELRKGEEVYIVDLALDDNIMVLIRHCVDSEAKVIHIDHHESTLKFISKLTPSNRAYINSITHFYETGISASLMTYAYSCFTDEQQRNPEEVAFYDKNDCRDLFIEENTYGYSIPLAIRYINDYDIWKFALKETEEFHAGFYACPWKDRPWDEGWKNLFMSENALVPPIIESGHSIKVYIEKTYEQIRKRAFDIHTDFGHGIFINTDAGTSKVFGNMLKEYDFGCMFYFNGEEWKYELRSAEGKTNVADIAITFGGGGHANAAGFKCGELIPIIEDHLRKLGTGVSVISVENI